MKCGWVDRKLTELQGLDADFPLYMEIKLNPPKQVSSKLGDELPL